MSYVSYGFGFVIGVAPFLIGGLILGQFLKSGDRKSAKQAKIIALMLIVPLLYFMMQMSKCYDMVVQIIEGTRENYGSGAAFGALDLWMWLTGLLLGGLVLLLTYAYKSYRNDASHEVL